ncbi:MAG: hypothetical protein AAF533_29615 [Acidobacteriota bacterium]
MLSRSILTLLLCLPLVAPLPVRAQAPTAQAIDALSEEDRALILELAAGLRPQMDNEKGRIGLIGLAEGLLQSPRRQQLLARWLRYCKSELDEKGASGWINHRTVTMAILGPPGGIHRESSRAWNGEMANEIGSSWNLMLKLAGQPLEEEIPEAWEMEDPYPSEAWVYPQADGTLRVIWFIDDEETGAYRMVRDQSNVPQSALVSRAPRIDLPAGLFGDATGTTGGGAAGPATSIRDLPELDDNLLEPTLNLAFFKSGDPSKGTQVRFVVGVDAELIELEFDAEPKAFLEDSKFWLRLSRGGEAFFQDAFPPTAAALAAVEAGEAYIDELTNRPVPAGKIEYQVRLVDSEGRGGEATGTVEIPAFDSGALISSVVMAKAVAGGLPKAKGPGETMGGGDDFEPFKIGSYVVRPHIEGTFRAGESLALVTQVYGPSTLEYDLWRGAKLAGQLDEVSVSKAQTEVQILDVTEAWSPGKYRFVVTATSGGKSTKREVPFQVKR